MCGIWTCAVIGHVRYMSKRAKTFEFLAFLAKTAKNIRVFSMFGLGEAQAEDEVKPQAIQHPRRVFF